MIPKSQKITWKGKEGLERAIEALRKFFEYNGRIPKTRDLPSIYAAIKRGNWKTLDIRNWYDILQRANFPINTKGHSVHINWEGKPGLDFAKELAINFSRTKMKSPRTKDLPKIYSAIYSKYWVRNGIRTWNDFLNYCKLPQNRGNKWKGKSGLTLAIQTFQNFKKKFGKDPNILDLKAIFSQINDGMWHEFNIFSWNDFVNKSSIEVNYVEEETSIKRHITELEF